VLRAHVWSSAPDNIVQLAQQVFVLLACHARHEALIAPLTLTAVTPLAALRVQPAAPPEPLTRSGGGVR
jgi:hypothetical protein